MCVAAPRHDQLYDLARAVEEKRERERLEKQEEELKVRGVREGCCGKASGRRVVVPVPFFWIVSVCALL